MQEVSITPEGIQKNLKNYKPLDALCEYIWNGFDARAANINVQLHCNQLGVIYMITVIDNGTGIPYEELQYKYKPFNDSRKASIAKRNNHSLPHGHQGIGRLTFYSFARKARWETIYVKEGDNYKYYIDMDKDSLNQYDDKEMNIFMIRQDRKGDVTENIVVELKRPSIALGEDQLSQVKIFTCNKER